MPTRVSPTDRIRGEIDALFHRRPRPGRGPRGRRTPRSPADPANRGGGRSHRVPRPRPLRPRRSRPRRAPQRLSVDHGEDHRRSRRACASHAAGHRHRVRVAVARQARDQDVRVGVASSAARTRALPAWLHYYNHHRPHGSLDRETRTPSPPTEQRHEHLHRERGFQPRVPECHRHRRRPIRPANPSQPARTAATGRDRSNGRTSGARLREPTNPAGPTTMLVAD